LNASEASSSSRNLLGLRRVTWSKLSSAIAVDPNSVTLGIAVEIDQQPPAVFGVPQFCKDRITDLIKRRQRDVRLSFEIAVLHQAMGKHMMLAV
jgi:hypothetical protein